MRFPIWKEKNMHTEWVIKVDRKEIGLTGSEYELIKKAALSGKTMVWLEDMVISIPHISYMEKVKRPMSGKFPQLPTSEVRDLSSKIKEAKKKYLKL
jgi:hypothetical protein